MTSIVNQITTRVATSGTYSTESVVLSSIAIILLLSLLIFKELLRASGHPRRALWNEVLNLAIVPLTIAFCYLVIIRFLALLPT